MTDTATPVALTPAARDRTLPPAAPSGMPALSRFGVPLGLAGLGGGWSAARSTLGSPAWPEEILYGAAGSLWLIMTAVYVFRGLRRKGAFRADLRHELAGPFASFIPLVGILLSAHYSQYLPPWGAWLCMAFIAALALVAAQLLAHWVTGAVVFIAQGHWLMLGLMVLIEVVFILAFSRLARLARIRRLGH